MKFSIHAAQQSQRRGVNLAAVNFVLECGDEYSVGRGCSLFHISAKERRFLKSEYPELWKSGRDHQRVALVVSENAVVTVMHRYKKLRKSKRFV